MNIDVCSFTGYLLAERGCRCDPREENIRTEAQPIADERCATIMELSKRAQAQADGDPSSRTEICKPMIAHK